MIHPYASDHYAVTAANGDQLVKSSVLNTWLRTRQIPGTPYRDACGLYPFSADIRPASKAAIAMELEAYGLVSLVLITDPFQTGTDGVADWDVCRSYKEHFLIDLKNGPPAFSRHHRQEVRRSLKTCTVRQIELGDYLNEWSDLYDNLVKRHNLGDMHHFSKDYFRRLANDSAFSAVAAFSNDTMVSCHIWARQEQVIYSHLAASSDIGYANSASYAVYAYAVGHFEDAQVIDIGGVPDRTQNSAGLLSFKRGFSNAVRSNYLCGVVARPDVYSALCRDVSGEARTAGYFPLYRTRTMVGGVSKHVV